MDAASRRVSTPTPVIAPNRRWPQTCVDALSAAAVRFLGEKSEQNLLNTARMQLMKKALLPISTESVSGKFNDDIVCPHTGVVSEFRKALQTGGA